MTDENSMRRKVSGYLNNGNPHLGIYEIREGNKVIARQRLTPEQLSIAYVHYHGNGWTIERAEG